MTHALLKDMNGNQVAITKAAVDVLTIYATVYITFSTSDASLQICGLPDSNPLMNYLVGGSSIGNCYFYTGESKQALGPYNAGLISNTILGTTAAITWTADVANKKMTTSTPRFAVGESNGHLKEIVFGTAVGSPIFRILLPASSIYSGLSLAGVTIGSGDGATKSFALPSRNINSSGLKVYLDGVETSAYTKGIGSRLALQRRDMPWGLGSARGRKGACMSRNSGVVSCVEDRYEDNTVYTFDWSDGLKYKGNTNVADVGYDTSLSDNGSVLAVAHATSPYISTFDWTAGAWVKRADPSNLPVGTARGCSLSGNGLVLAVAHDSSPYISTYDWTAGAWVKRDNPASLPAGRAYSVSLSKNGLIMAVAHDNSPYTTTYDWTDGAWVKRADPANLPTGSGRACDLTDDGAVLAVGHANSPYFTVYDWSGSAWVKRANPTSTPVTTICDIAIGKTSGNVLIVMNESGAHGMGGVHPMQVYDWSGSAWVKRADSAFAGTYSSGRSCCISPNEKLCLGTHSDGGSNVYMMTLMDLDAYTENILFDSAPAKGAVITADYTVDGIHKTTQRVIDLNATITFGEPA
jgi:hypothetical protein